MRTVQSFFRRPTGTPDTGPLAPPAAGAEAGGTHPPPQAAPPPDEAVTAPTTTATLDGDADEADLREHGGDPAPEEGVHAITRATDHWFERRADALEQRAHDEAEAWARAGLPLQDVAYTEPLDVEVVLASHARHVYRDWAERVRTKMQDAIARGSRGFAAQVGELRHRIGRLDAIAEELAVREGRIERIRDESARDLAPVQYHRFVPSAIFWPMVVLLVMVEFAANFPVFRLLLPLDSTLSNAARIAAENVRDDSWLAGIQLFARGLVMNIEALVVALVVVIALVVLAKQVGGSLRPILALSPAEHPLAATTIRAHRRQQWAMVAMCGLGLAAVLWFLYSARGSIAATADSRVTADSAKLAAIAIKQDAARAAGNVAAIADLSRQQQELQDIYERHRDDAAYARTIAANNEAIMFLNFGLVLVAAVLGFGHARDNLSDRRGEHPDLPILREKCAELRQEQLQVLVEARAALARAASAEGAVRHLAQASPLASWESKARRLNAIVPHFRAENARLRGLDPSNVNAFALPSPLSLPPIESAPGFRLPDELAAFAAERDELAARLGEHRVHTPSAAVRGGGNGRLKPVEVAA